jgi:hypothetical protein
MMNYVYQIKTARLLVELADSRAMAQGREIYGCCSDDKAKLNALIDEIHSYIDVLNDDLKADVNKLDWSDVEKEAEKFIAEG